MPRELWRVKIYCPHSGCAQKELTSAGLYPNIRQVLAIDGYYNLAAEYLEQSKNMAQLSTSWTWGTSCCSLVICLLRQRGLGNSATQLQRKLTEQHSERWLVRMIQYLNDCKHFRDASNIGL
ncbi:unnamed protein product [Porites lobata]|uniref:DUF6729 domain-containing protein n=1 Tax=Porites lobata TaxID=104759 RepID=A0ABN8RFC6_9CNID|nr:unnamed protein product [Porites lobata]